MELLEYAPYIPDVALSKYHVFGPLKIAVSGRHSTSDQRVKLVHELLVSEPKLLLMSSYKSLWSGELRAFNPYPTAFPYGNGMVLHFYQQ